MSMQNTEMVNRLAFVGNLPPDATQEEMKQLCSQVGEVILFRIVYDRETGKPKGYGFCEYRDSKLVDSAVELLHGFEHRGASLYVRRANQEKQPQQAVPTSSDSHQHANNGQNNGHEMSAASNSNAVHSGNKLLKKKKKSSSKRKSVDEIQRVVQSFSTSEKREILSQMKRLIEQNEKGAKEILLENPQLAQALLWIQMDFGLLKSTDIHALTKLVSNQIAKPVETPSQSQSQSQSLSISTPSMQTQSVTETASQSQSQAPSNPATPTPTTAAMNTDVSNVEEVEQEDNDVEMKEDKLQGLSEEQQRVLGHVMHMTDDQIAKLPEAVQKQIRAVKAQLAKRQKNVT
mmetsp:Transcript_31028/g.49832  ORF Transcript_31028/g.49832 Transcript_31028/m.49832 type:complete len:346 (+) Transcript_31028:1311-2348(+)